jgi:hypothetical protein
MNAELLLRSVVGIVPMAAWFALDPELPRFLWIARAALSGEDNGLYLDYALATVDNTLRIRLCVAVVLIWVTMAALSLWRAVARVLDDDQSSFRDWRPVALAATVHLAAVLLVLMVSGWISQSANHRRALAIGARVDRVSQELFENWPTTFTSVPALGRVGVHPKDPNQIFVLSRLQTKSSFIEGIGVCIYRNTAGDALLIGLTSCSWPQCGANSILYFRDESEEPTPEALREFQISRNCCTRLNARSWLVVPGTSYWR